MTLTYISYAPGQTVASYGFEDGALPYSFQGYNGATVSVDPAAARSGSYGLKISRLSGASGLQFSIPSYSLGAYHVTAWMRSAPGESGRRVVLRMRTSTGSAGIGSAGIASNAWSALDGYFSPESSTINACGGPISVGRTVTAILTLEEEACGCVVPTTAYLDDLRITYTGLSPTSPPSGGAGCQPPTTTTTSTTTTSPTTTTTTTTTATTTASPSVCRIQYALVGHWSGGWQSAVTLTNISTQPLSNWVLEWTFAGPGNDLAALVGHLHPDRPQRGGETA